MVLQTYRQKRNFQRTPEPRGVRGSTRSGYHFVIQKHAARRLHYDFRLELDGTLKSWAVPKGPSLDPRARRLAVHVEDHPLAYGRFEGNIPEREYGAGAVIVWDRGKWRPEGNAHESYRRGRLRFRLDGEKLHGTWNLIRTGGKQAAGGKENWLLIKSRDDYASDVDIVEQQPNSVQSGRSLEEVATKFPASSIRTVTRKKISSAAAARAPATNVRKISARARLPATLQPQLATLVETAPTGDEWLHEIKYDGYRMLCRVTRGGVHLYTRNGKDLTTRMAAVARAVEKLSGLGEAWLDGEVVALTANGQSSFSELQLALSERRDKDLVYFLFDLPYVDGRDLTAQPLSERKKILTALLKNNSHPQLRYSDHQTGSGTTFYRHACKLGLEGVVSKRADAPYRSLRTATWVKSKCRMRQEFVIGGYSDPGGTRHGFGALLLGVYDDSGSLRYCGRTGTGFGTRLLKTLHPRLQRLEQRESPFADPIPPPMRKGVHWIRPEIVADVEFTSWTRDGLARQAAFQGVREDKPPREVVREKARPLAAAIATEAQPRRKRTSSMPASASTSRLTNADKILYPEQGLTKADIAMYYAAVKDWLLPHLVRRPLTLVRCPEGRHQSCFFQKHAAQGTPPELLRVMLAEGKGKRAPYLALNSIEGVLALVQMGVLEIHVWGSLIDKPELPDRLVFDFDPDPALPWKRVIEAAALAHARLTALGLNSFLRTTGGKGLHVVVPLRRRLAWDDIKIFARAFADDMVRQDPARFTARLPLAARRGKIFIDYLRNGRGATAITNYSTRARVGAPVALPLAWDELTPALRPQAHTVKTVPARLQELKRDPWRDFLDASVSVTRAMQRELGIKR